MCFRAMLKQSSMLVTAAVLASASLPSSASETLTETDVRSIVEQHRRGDILKIEQTRINGRLAYAVTFMNAGGDANHAFQVYTLVIDAESGTLMPETVNLQPNRTRTAGD